MCVKHQVLAQNGVAAGACGHRQCLGVCDIPKGESGDVVAAFNRHLTRRYPHVKFKGYDVACTWMNLLGFSELGVSAYKSHWCVGAFHKNAHTHRFGECVTCVMC